MAILLEIFKAEQRSVFREKIDLDKRKSDWYFFLFNQLTDKLLNKSRYQISENIVTFITLNYDRSLEHFLCESLINSFGEIPEKAIIEEVKKLKFIHVYGQIENLERQNKHGAPYKVEEVHFYGKVETLTGNIRTIHDVIDSEEIRIRNR